MGHRTGWGQTRIFSTDLRRSLFRWDEWVSQQRFAQLLPFRLAGSSRCEEAQEHEWQRLHEVTHPAKRNTTARNFSI